MCRSLPFFKHTPSNLSFHIFSIHHFSVFFYALNPLLFLKIFGDRIFYVDFKVYHSCWKWFNWKKFTSLCSEWIRHLFLRPRNCLPVVWAWKYLVIKNSDLENIQLNVSSISNYKINTIAIEFWFLMEFCRILTCFVVVLGFGWPTSHWGWALS